MGLFEHFPYVNTHNINLDWIISKVKGLSDKVDSFEHSAIPTGGSTGQALVKNSDEDYDAKWATVVGERGPQGPQGLQGPEGPQGPQGVPGADGQGFVIVGQYDTFDEFMEEHWAIHEDDVGTAYYIGEEAAEDYYILLGTYIQYQEGRGLGWLNIGQIKGQKGDTGAQGPQGPQGNPGADGVGIPEGGSTGQVLAKASGSDYDTEWVTASAAELTVGRTYIIPLYKPTAEVYDEVNTSSMSPRIIDVPIADIPLDCIGHRMMKIDTFIMAKDELRDTNNGCTVSLIADDGTYELEVAPSIENNDKLINEYSYTINHKGQHYSYVNGTNEAVGITDESRAWGSLMSYQSIHNITSIEVGLPQTTKLQIGFSYLTITIY